MRIPLENKIGDPWTDFEALLFNLISRNGDRKIPGYFSNRLEVAQRMLDAYDNIIDKLQDEEIEEKL